MRQWTGAAILAAARAPQAEQRLKLLEAALDDLLQRDAEKDELIRRMQAEFAALRSGDRTPPAQGSVRLGRMAPTSTAAKPVAATPMTATTRAPTAPTSTPSSSAAASRGCAASASRPPSRRLLLRGRSDA